VLSCLASLPLFIFLLYPTFDLAYPPLPLWLAAWMLSGISAGVLLYRIGLFFSMIGSATKAVMVMMSGLFVTALLYLIIALIGENNVALCLMAISPSLVTLLLHLAKHYVPKEKNYDDLESTRSWRLKPIYPLSILLFSGLVFGFPASLSTQFTSKDNGGGFWVLAIIIAIALLLVLTSFLTIKRRIFVSSIQNHCLPLAGIALLTLAFSFEPLNLICISLAILCFFWSICLHILVVADFMRELKVNAVSLFCADFMALGIGATIGWLIGWLAQAYSEALPNLTMVSTVTLAILVMIVLDLRGRSKDEEVEALFISTPNSNEGHWRQRCGVICQQAKLSPRQREVFMFLAKGRNTTFISSELFIAPHTAKAHIYRIYQKLGIHSQQELIDLIEKRSR
jgi:DNA-binding CsgD family transcriptional regulator